MSVLLSAYGQEIHCLPYAGFKKNHSLSPFYGFHWYFFFTVFHPFSPFSITFNWLSKHFTVYQCFFTFLKTNFNCFFYHFQTFFFSHYFQPFFTILHRYYYLQTTRDSVSPVCRIFFGKISVLLTFPFW